LTADAKRSLKRFWLPVAVALAIHAALGMSAAARLTATHDEYWHLPVGLLNLKTGRFHFDNLNPPLCRMAAALPLLFTSAQTGPVHVEHDAMGWGDAFVASNSGHYRTWFFVGRTMIVLISVLGGLVTAIWARELFGDVAGCFAALLWAFEPNLLANGSLVTTDMGAAAFFVFAVYALWRFAKRPGWKTALLFGAALGLAQLAKFTSLLLYPISIVEFAIIAFAGTVVVTPSQQRTDDKKASAPRKLRPATIAAEDSGSPERFMDAPTSIARLSGLWIVALLTSLLVLNAGYLFRGSFSSLKTYDLQSVAMRGVAQRFASIGWMPVPLPRDYVEGLDHQRHIMQQKHPVFLDGQWSEDGIPNYYLWGLFYKLPHPLQLLAIFTLFWVVVPGKVARRLPVQLMILLPAFVMIGIAELSTMQLGIRYVLPAIPFLILFASQAALWFDFKVYPFRTLTTAVLAAWMLLSVRYHPHHLAYFNELAGGPLGGREHLLDSNLDWGQDLGGLKEFLDSRKISEIGLAYFGTVPPSSLGIAYHIPPSRSPQQGRYAVSVNFEQGRPHWVRTPRGEIRPVDIGEFEYFRFFEPIARIGYTIDVFDLSPADVARWRAAALGR
jgi:4-amino-4-deoxy-L-arabinose transferase-like glycosyltransferase